MKCEKIPKTLDIALYPTYTVKFWMNEREEVCDELKQMVVKEKDKEEEGFLNWILERIPGCEKIGFVPIIHDLICYFLNYRNEKLPQEEKKREKDMVRKDRKKSKRTNSPLETQPFPPQSSWRSNAMRVIVGQDLPTSEKSKILSCMKTSTSGTDKEWIDEYEYIHFLQDTGRICGRIIEGNLDSNGSQWQN
jgi:hypothetical protein